MDQFNVNDQWLFYLEKTLQKESTMHPIQLSETKRAFYAAFGQCLLIIRDEVPKCTGDPIEKLENMAMEISYFWQNEIRKRTS